MPLSQGFGDQLGWSADGEHRPGVPLGVASGAVWGVRGCPRLTAPPRSQKLEEQDRRALSVKEQLQREHRFLKRRLEQLSLQSVERVRTDSTGSAVSTDDSEQGGWGRGCGRGRTRRWAQRLGGCLWGAAARPGPPAGSEPQLRRGSLPTLVPRHPHPTALDPKPWLCEMEWWAPTLKGAPPLRGLTGLPPCSPQKWT